jgi:hypothetical protein
MEEATYFSETFVDFNRLHGITSQKTELYARPRTQGPSFQDLVGIWTLSRVFMFCTETLRYYCILILLLGLIGNYEQITCSLPEAFILFISNYKMSQNNAAHRDSSHVFVHWRTEIVLSSRIVVSVLMKVKLSLRLIEHHVMKTSGGVSKVSKSKAIPVTGHGGP